LLIGVTVLTSFGDENLPQVGLKGSARDQVLLLARLARSSGLDGVVCSAQEASLIRAEIAKPFLLVTPGIRLPGAASDDQSRIVTPRQAVEMGADYLVIGRPITQSTDPVATLQQIRDTIAPVTTP
jgi:orotidine-5'-phosphate decarboxylase